MKKLPGISLVLVVVMFIAAASSVLGQEANVTEKQRSKLIKRFPKSDANKDGKLDDEELLALRDFLQNRRRKADSAAAENGKSQAAADPWRTAGFKQVNTMGGGEAAIPENGKFRVFVLMGQSNMHGTARANELKPPYTKKHERIRIWANGRWEYFVPTQRFGPGVSFAHQLAQFWPEDTIGIIKISIGGTGIRSFEKDWSRERASLTFDGEKGSLYKDLMNAVTEAKTISKPEFCGFVWKQGGADGTKKVLANEYYETFKQLISDLRSDLGVPDLPVFVPSYTDDDGLIKAFTAKMSDQDRAKIKDLQGKDAAGENVSVEVLLKFLNDASLAKLRQLSGKRPYIVGVVAAQNRAGREISEVTTLFPGPLPKGADGTHYTAEGYITLGKITATAVQDYFQAKK
ncbi:MAG: sialate O-acetylesterase [Rubripirellula sp.]